MLTGYVFRIIRLMVFGLSLILVTGVGYVQSQAQDMIVYEDIPYLGSDIPYAWLDVYLPTGVEAPYPTVVYVTPPANGDEDLFESYGQHLIEQGYAAVAIRIRPQYIFPDSFCGLAWVHASTGEYGFDSQRIAAFGISGSGIPAALLGAIDRDVDNPFMAGCPYPEPEGSWVQGVVTYEALFLTPPGLGEELIRSDGARFSGLPREELDTLFDLLIQTPPAEWRDIGEADPEHRLFLQSFPLYWVDGDEPPFLLIYGSESELNWIEDEQQFFASQLEAVGAPVELVEKAGLRHSVEALAGHTEEMDSFLAEIFADGGSEPALEPITPENASQITQLNVLGQAGDHQGVYSAAFSPDGRTIASGDAQGRVCLWNASTGEMLTELEDYPTFVPSVAFNPDGRFLAAGSGYSGGYTVRLWDVTTGNAVHILDDFDNPVYSVAFSPDGATLATGGGDPLAGPGSFQLWDVATGGLLVEVEPQHIRAFITVSTYYMAFSPDGQLLATANGDGTLRLWDATSGQERTILNEEVGWYTSGVTFNFDGTLLAAGVSKSGCAWGNICRPEQESGGIYLWDVEAGEPFTVLAGHVGSVSSVAFSPDGRIVASGGYDGVRLWDVTAGVTLVELESITGGVSTVAFNPDGTTLLTGGWDGTVRLWGVPAES